VNIGGSFESNGAPVKFVPVSGGTFWQKQPATFFFSPAASGNTMLWLMIVSYLTIFTWFVENLPAASPLDLQANVAQW
jgi:hypothetical protein